MFLVINAFVLNKYDVFLLARRKKIEVITSKLIILIIGSSVLSVTLYLLFLITGQFLTPYMTISIKDLAILGDLVIFGGVYLLLYSLLYFYGKTIYSLLIIVIGYFVSDITIEYYELKSSVSVVSKTLNFIFVNIGYYQDGGYCLYYGKVYGIILVTLLFLLITFKYLKSDIEN